MPNSFAYDLTMALIPGAVAGYYAGLLMAKQSKFNSLKHEALRCIRSIDFIGDEEETTIFKYDRVSELHLIASELLHLKHQRAGAKLSVVASSASQLIATHRIHGVPVKEVMEALELWQNSIRSLRPGFRFLLPWGQL